MAVVKKAAASRKTSPRTPESTTANPPYVSPDRLYTILKRGEFEYRRTSHSNTRNAMSNADHERTPQAGSPATLLSEGSNEGFEPPSTSHTSTNIDVVGNTAPTVSPYNPMTIDISKRKQDFCEKKTLAILRKWEKQNLNEVFPEQLWPFELLGSGAPAMVDSPENKIRPVKQLGVDVLDLTAELASCMEWTCAKLLIEAIVLARQTAKGEGTTGIYALQYKKRGVTADDVEKVLKEAKAGRYDAT